VLPHVPDRSSLGRVATNAHDPPDLQVLSVLRT
jgi:hypothetical protein